MPSQHVQPLTTFKGTLLLLSILLLQSCLTQKLEHLAPVEIYPDDTWLQAQANKKALIIVAHDDDAISSAGTISMLTTRGWEVHMLCFYHDIPENINRNLQRQQDVQQAIAVQGIRSITFHTLNYRAHHTAYPTLYAYVPESMRDSIYQMDTLTQLIQQFIEQHQPSVIFTLDDVIGGYGHPDHVVVSQIVKEYALAHPQNIKRVYQAVFSPHQANTIMEDLPVYQDALVNCACTGQPIPTTQINISAYGAQKQAAMQTYSTEQHNLQKFWPKYDKMPAEKYFSIFDREFFHVIETE